MGIRGVILGPVVAGIFAFIVLLSESQSLAVEPRPVSSTRPAGTLGTVVVPDHFLRRWDPVTIRRFFHAYLLQFIRRKVSAFCDVEPPAVLLERFVSLIRYF